MGVAAPVSRTRDILRRNSRCGTEHACVSHSIGTGGGGGGGVSSSMSVSACLAAGKTCALRGGVQSIGVSGCVSPAGRKRGPNRATLMEPDAPRPERSPPGARLACTRASSCCNWALGAGCVGCAAAAVRVWACAARCR